jgi:gluconokinase
VSATQSPPPIVLLLMGVSGSGKTTVGRRLAQDLGWDFVDADDLHSPENVAKMSRGIALTDEDRAGWLRALETLIAERIATARPAVVASSALKRSYRDRLVQGSDRVRVAFLDGPEELLRERLRNRRGHYAGEDLLASQLATLEEPAPDEGILRFSIEPPPEEIAAAIREAFGPPAKGDAGLRRGAERR